MPVNGLIIRRLLNLYPFYGPEFKVECPTGSGKYLTLFEVAKEIGHRLSAIFLRDASGCRPVYGGTKKFQEDPIGGITSFSTNTSMVTMARGWAPATRPAGRG